MEQLKKRENDFMWKRKMISCVEKVITFLSKITEISFFIIYNKTKNIY